MEYMYPAILKKQKDGSYFVKIIDLDVMTQGKNLQNAIHMAEDVICLKLIELQDNNQKLPNPTEILSIECDKQEVSTLVMADPDLYRKKQSALTVKKNCTVQAWLCAEAEKAGINFSAALQRGLKEELGI